MTKETKEDQGKRCHFCKEEFRYMQDGTIRYPKRVIYSNNRGEQTFIYMPIGAQAHLECYTQEIMKITIEVEESNQPQDNTHLLVALGVIESKCDLLLDSDDLDQETTDAVFDIGKIAEMERIAAIPLITSSSTITLETDRG